MMSLLAGLDECFAPLWLFVSFGFLGHFSGCLSWP